MAFFINFEIIGKLAETLGRKARGPFKWQPVAIIKAFWCFAFNCMAVVAMLFFTKGGIHGRRSLYPCSILQEKMWIL